MKEYSIKFQYAYKFSTMFRTKANGILTKNTLNKQNGHLEILIHE